MGYKRNLTTGEIVDQYFMAAKENGKKSITNIVYMGMGEPLLNYGPVLDAAGQRGVDLLQERAWLRPRQPTLGDPLTLLPAGSAG